MLAGGNLSSPVDEGSSSTRQEPDRAASDQRGQDESGKTGLEPNSAQTPEIERRIYRRRRGQLKAFATVAAALLCDVAWEFRLKRKGKGKRKASGGGAR